MQSLAPHSRLLHTTTGHNASMMPTLPPWAQRTGSGTGRDRGEAKMEQAGTAVTGGAAVAAVPGDAPAAVTNQ